MAENKTEPTNVSVDTFLSTIAENRRDEAMKLIKQMKNISGKKPVMWGPSIIGFGQQLYKYDSGREGDMPLLGFSPRKASITIYFSEGFDRYNDLLISLGRYRISVSCLYINKLVDIDLVVLQKMLDRSFGLASKPMDRPATVEEYIARIPIAARPHFDSMRIQVKSVLPGAKEVLSYGIVGYKLDEKRASVFISGWKDHVAIYPVPKDESLYKQLKPYVKGKGTIWFSLDDPLPKSLIVKIVKALCLKI